MTVPALTNLRVLTLTVALAAVAVLAMACTGGDGGPDDSTPTVAPSLVQTPRGDTTTPTPVPTVLPTATNTPVEPLSFAVADYIEDIGWGILLEKEGWRRVGVFVDMEYHGGISGDALCQEGAFDRTLAPVAGWRGGAYRSPSYGDMEEFLSFTLQTPEHAEYELYLDADKAGWYKACLEMVPGLKTRLFLVGEVPEVLQSLAGFTVVVRLEPFWGYDGEPRVLTSTPIQKDESFTTNISERARPFGETIQAEWGSWTVSSVGTDVEQASGNVDVWINLAVTNESSYDVDPADVLGKPLGWTLIDSRGYPYVAFGGIHDEGYELAVSVPPGYSEEWQLTVTDKSPEGSPADLSDVFIILNPGGYVFRGSGQ